MNAKDYGYKVTIEKPYGRLDNVIDWCATELDESNWRLALTETSTKSQPGLYTFYFNNEKDRIAFTLKWC